MPLFQHSIIKKYLSELDQALLDAAWERFQKHFHNAAIQQNILQAKEEEYQEGFVRDLFVNVFAYTLKPQPDYNLVLEKKSTTDATKSDGAILSPDGNVIAVIELKDTATADLGKVERQAFGYKHQHKDCRYIITSNFQQLRFYINDAIDYEAFDLFRLDKNSFALLYCCLQQKALQNDVPQRMKQQSLAAEENVTKKLYDDYSRFKKQLFENITLHNRQYDRLLLFKKTQKLLDRFLFILFAEDRGLLPPNSVREILNQWEQLKELDNYVPLYERFKKYFGYLNTGYSGKTYEIFAYNGGLFAPDEILDNIRIDDELLFESCKGLSNYDFESEIDVNILGHIFEHSLNEIEEIEQQLKEGETIAGKKTSKRKKDGVFYTPRYITKYIVENTVGALCIAKRKDLNIIDEEYVRQKRKARREDLLHKLEVYRDWLLHITICDPACGSGAFLNQALEFLIAEHQSIDTLKAKLFGDAITFTDVEDSILENNLYGVDINEEAVEIAKLSLWLRTARKGRKLNSLTNNIKCGNSLISDPAVAGEKAFHWEKEFPDVFADERQNFLQSIQDFKELAEKHKKTPEELDQIFQNLDKKHFADIERIWGAPVTTAKEYIKAALTLMHPPNQRKMMWLGLLVKNPATSALLLEFAENNHVPIELVFEVIIENFLLDLGVNFDQYADTFTPDNSGGFDVVIGNPPYGAFFNEIEKKEISKFKTFKYRFESYVYFFEKGIDVVKKGGFLGFITPELWLNLENCQPLRSLIFNETDLIEVNIIGENAFADAVVNTAITVLCKEKKRNAFTIIRNEIKSKHLYSQWENSPLLAIEYRISDAKRALIGKIEANSQRLDDYGEVIQGITPYDKYRGQDPDLIKARAYHFSYKKDDTCGRWLNGEDVNRYSLSWSGEWLSYGEWLAAPREKKYFENARLLFREIPGKSRRIQATLIDETSYYGHSITPFILSENNNLEILKKLLCIANSSLLSWYGNLKLPNFGKNIFPKLNPQDIKLLPIHSELHSTKLPFIAKADIMLSKNKELQSVKQQILQLLQSKYEGITISKKLQDWPGLSFMQFLKELEKQKTKLSLPAQSEWMQYFESEKAKANAIQQLLDKTDKEIDEMVYELYGLTEEERRVVEEG
jgi:type I restriction-modification system DNA methylase subunit